MTIETDNLAGLYDYAQRPPRLPEVPDAAGETAGLDSELRLKLYRLLQMLRQFERRVHDLFLQNLVDGTTHLSLGMEAVAAGFGVALRPSDYTFGTYRGHAHTLARGAPMPQMLAELCGRATGILGGKGGSMHLTSVEHGAMGSYAIIGAHLCVANGAAWSAQLRGTDQVTACFFGDGTTNIGAFHEALNLAAVWRLPIVFVCENNLYMEYTPIDLVTAVPRPAADRASAYGLEPIVVDGNDTDAVYLVACEVIERARRGEGPSLVEALTYRSGGHSRADPAQYRPPEEVAAWDERDPILVCRERLLRLGVSEAKLEELEREVSAAVDAATEFALASPPPEESVLLTNLFADGGSAWRN